jgi:hypothetical protein
MNNSRPDDKQILDIVLPILKSSPSRYGEDVMELRRVLEQYSIFLSAREIGETLLRSGMVERVEVGKPLWRYKKD